MTGEEYATKRLTDAKEKVDALMKDSDVDIECDKYRRLLRNKLIINELFFEIERMYDNHPVMPA